MFHDRAKADIDIAGHFVAYKDQVIHDRTVVRPIPEKVRAQASGTISTGGVMKAPVGGKPVPPLGGVAAKATRKVNGKPAAAPQIVANGLFEGQLIFKDRDYAYGKVPDQIRGADLVLTYNSDKKRATAEYGLTVSAPSTLIVLLDTRIDGLAWMKGGDGRPVFKDQGYTVTTQEAFIFKVFTADVAAGTYTFGDQEGASFYTLGVLKKK